MDGLLSGPSFCVKPWVHVHVATDGDVQACCVSPVSFGNLQKRSLQQIWHGEEARRFRAAHLLGKPVAGCERCYQAESVGAFSMRKNANDYFGPRASEAIRTTTAAGVSPEARPVDYDIRFSNVCNLKCRTCHHGSSSRWYEDQIALGWKPGGQKAILRAFDGAEDFWNSFGGFVDDIEKVYFAGGEPLLQPEHYDLLRALDERKRHDTFIAYNTNLSVLDYRGTDVTTLWRRFQRLHVSASLDASGARGELMRHGQSWARVLANRERIRRECPNVIFRTACTVGALNAWHLPDFHRELIDTGFIDPEQFDINLAHGLLDAQVLPAHLKQEIRLRNAAHAAWLRSIGEDSTAERFDAFVCHLGKQDRSDSLGKFRFQCDALDRLRSESTAEVFPELASTLRPLGQLQRLSTLLRARAAASPPTQI